MEKFLIVGIGILGLLIGLRFYIAKKIGKEFKKDFDDLINSDEYKVKSQFD